MERVIPCLNTEFNIILEFILSKSLGGRSWNWVSTGRIIYSFYSVNEANFVSSGDHIQTYIWKQICYTWQIEGSRTKKAKGHLWPEHIWDQKVLDFPWAEQHWSIPADAHMFLRRQLHRVFPTYYAHKFPTAWQQLLSMFIKTFKITVSVLDCTTIKIWQSWFFNIHDN